MNQSSTKPRARTESSSPEERRGFLAKAAAVAIGAIVFVFPFAAGMGPLLDPVLRRKKEGEKDPFTPLAKLSELPEDGTPKRFQVITDRDDAWSRQPRQPVGAVYLRRLGGEKIQAFTATCPHAGCFVAFKEDTSQYLCPCHQSPFSIDGEVIQPSPSPRDMDTLEWEIRPTESGEKLVHVNFQQFYTGRAAKEPKA